MSSISDLYPDASSPIMSSPTKSTNVPSGSASSDTRDVAASSSSSSSSFAVDSDSSPTPSLLERVAGVQGSHRRFVSWYITAFTLATTVRVACFHPLVFGNYLVQNLAPVEREDVRWGYILLVRAYDLAVGAYVWNKVDGIAKRDGALFGAILASVSRIGLLVFERAYFLLSTETVSTLFLIDLVSLIAAFSMLPIFLPHSIESRPTSSALMRLERHPELLINLALAIGLSTFVCAFLGYSVERLGAQQFIKARTFERGVPSVLLADSLTPLEMLEHPTIPIPSLRAYLEPLSMPRHLVHALFLSLLTIPFVSILPTYSPWRLGSLAFALVTPQTSTMLWDVLPLEFEAALYVGLFEGLKAALASGMSAWVLEELRARREKVETTVAIAVVGEDDKGSFVVVAEETIEEKPVASPNKKKGRSRKASAGSAKEE